MQINNKAYKLSDGDVLIETILKSMSKKQLNEIKHLAEAELNTRNFDYSVLLNFDNNYKYLISDFANADIFFQVGGICSGKTQAGMRECLFLAFGCNKKVACVHSNRFVKGNYEIVARSILNEYNISFFETSRFIRIIGNDGELYKNETIKSLPKLKDCEVIFVDDAECLTKKESEDILDFAGKYNIKLIFNIPFYKEDAEIYKICSDKSKDLKILCLESTYSSNQYCPKVVCEFAKRQMSTLSKSEYKRIWGV